MKLPETYEKFSLSLNRIEPNSQWSPALQSLWFLSKGNWNASHEIAQDLHTELGSWIHALLHRMEGDEFNAQYWYQQAGKPFSELTFDEEIKEIVDFILSSNKY
jgi:hypothetical protein